MREIGINIIGHVEAVAVLQRVVVLLGHGVDVLFVAVGYNVGNRRVIEAHQRFQKGIDVDLVFQLCDIGLNSGGRREVHKRVEVDCRFGHHKRVARKHIVLHTLYVVLHARGNRKYHRHAYYAYTARNGDHGSALDFGQQIFQRKHERHSERHRGLFLFALVGFLFGFLGGRGGFFLLSAVEAFVVYDKSVL